MKATIKKITVFVMAFALLLGMSAVPSQGVQAASKKVSIAKKVKVTVRKTAKIKLKNNKKKVKWKVTKLPAATPTPYPEGALVYDGRQDLSQFKQEIASAEEPVVVVIDKSFGVGLRAFSGCTNLGKVIISGKVTSIEEDAFENCTGLTEVVIEDGVTNIGDFAFNECKQLSRVTLPEGVLNIGRCAFQSCTQLS